MKIIASPAETRQSLLEAAGAVFAEHGYRGTTVREICQRARANVAAVNYHFGDKEQLYLEVLRHSHSQAVGKFPVDLGVDAKAPPAERLCAFIRSFLLRIFDTGPTAGMGKLMSMEMINPSHALDTLVEERIRPMADQLRGIVLEIMGAKANGEDARLCGLSIVSQCLFYVHCRSVVLRLYPNQQFEAEDIEKLAEHITRFSLAALKNFTGTPRKRR